MIYCTECGEPCKTVFMRSCIASDEWGDQTVYGEASDCCFVEFREHPDHEEEEDE